MALHRRAAKRDLSEPGIVDRLRQLGAAVVRLSGRDLPDLLVGWRGLTLLAEVKTGKAKLTDGQRTFYLAWTGSRPAVLRTPQEAQDWLLSHRTSVALVATPERLARAFDAAESSDLWPSRSRSHPEAPPQGADLDNDEADNSGRAYHQGKP